MVKYLFWACEQDNGIFEPLNEEDVNRYKRMSKYKKDELASKKLQNKDGSESEDENQQVDYSD